MSAVAHLGIASEQSLLERISLPSSLTLEKSAFLIIQAISRISPTFPLLI